MQKFQPHPYQVEAIKKVISQGCAGLFLDPGLGKTSITLSAIKILLDKKMIRGALVIAPLRPARVTWPAELEKWEQFQDLDMVVLHGKDKDELLNEKHDIYVINPEGLDWLFKPVFDRKSAKVPPSRMRELMQKFDMLVIDESTKFKSHASQRFKIMKSTLQYWKRRYILTGTPAPNGIMDLWSQIYLLDGGSSLNPYITHFKNMYFYTPPNGSQYDIRMFPGAEKIVAEKISHLVMRMKAEDYLTLPEMIYNRIEVELPPKVREQYDELEHEFMLAVEEGVITAANMAVLGNKLRQAVAGALYVQQGAQGNQAAHLHATKTEALAELVEELSGQPLLVGYDFVFEKDLIQKHIPQARFLDGKHDEDLIRMFNAGLIPVLVGNPASVGHGLNLQAACAHVAYTSLTWNLENYDQFIKRVLRQGNPNLRVVVHLIIVGNTKDEAVWRALQSKDRLQKTLLSHLCSR
jgi:SNF2 family DNA or RNA helicase